MYTQCPHCQAVFLVSAEHLKAAAGDVRCGQCLTVFNALNNLSEAAPPQTATPAFELEPSPGVSDTETGLPHSGELDTTSSAEQALEALLENNNPATNSEPHEPGETDHVAAPQNTHIEADDATAEAVLDAPPAAKVASEPLPEDDRQPRVTNRDATKIADEEAESLAAFFADVDAETAAAPIRDTASSIETQTPPSPAPDDALAGVPAVIRQQWQEEKDARLRPSRTPWALGSLFLMLVLVAQAAYFQRDQLVRDPQYRDWIIKACELADCTLAVPYDIKQIDIIGRDVRSHPRAKNGLIAATTLINNATFPQPFPLLTLTFSDINGTRLAQRRFTPSEYLDTHTDANLGMPPDVPVQIELELMDPGKAAVNFEFRAEQDPRSARWRKTAH